MNFNLLMSPSRSEPALSGLSAILGMTGYGFSYCPKVWGKEAAGLVTFLII